MEESGPRDAAGPDDVRGCADDGAAFMAAALEEARRAPCHGDVPIGAVVVRQGDVIAAAHNRRDVDADPTAHAEVLALRAAAQSLGTWHLTDCDVYVTLEPCTMCAGALVLGRVRRLYYGAADPKAGACGSLFNLTQSPRLNHRLEVHGGLLEEECSRILRELFEELRASKTKAE